jgi:hypothetical protein
MDLSPGTLSEPDNPTAGAATKVRLSVAAGGGLGTRQGVFLNGDPTDYRTARVPAVSGQRMN